MISFALCFQTWSTDAGPKTLLLFQGSRPRYYYNRSVSPFHSVYFVNRLEILLDMPPATSSVQQRHGWNPDDKSANVFVTNNDLTVHRHPVAQSTDAIRGKVGYSKGLHCWEIRWSTRQRGTHAMIGVCTTEAPLTCAGYRSLIGQNAESWGWDVGRNKLVHGSKSWSEMSMYPNFLESDENFVVPEKVLVALDMDEGTLSFIADGQYLGVAFTGLEGKTLYPTISCVWGHCEVGIRYINGLNRKFYDVFVRK